jgi:predicted nucleic-acid-binding Zn-ribbon protein
MLCSVCDQELPANANFCPHCGTIITLASALPAAEAEHPAAIGPTERLLPSSTRYCPKCQSEMERGFIPDEARNGMELQRWVEGNPERSIWTGLFKVGKRRQWYIRPYRCVECGYLEFYARQEVR